MDKFTALFPLVKAFQDADDKNESFEILLRRFTPLLTKYALLLGDIELKHDLAFDLHNALMIIPLHEERFMENKYILSYLRETIRHAAGKLWKEKKKHSGASIHDDFYANTLESNDDGLSDFWHDETLNEIKALLSADEFKIFMMAYEGYKGIEIAKHLAVSEPAVCKRLKKIRRKIISGLSL